MSEQKHIRRAAEDHTADAPLVATIGFRSQRGAAPASAPHAHKFMAISGFLLGVAVVAIAAAIALAVSSNPNGSGASWSAWKPTDTGAQGAQEIADHFAPFYRVSLINQLDVVTVVNLGNPNSVNPTTGVPEGTQVVVRLEQSSGLSLLPGNTIAYNLCGVNSANCSIGVGKPSTLRLLLLRREALELALYTLKYISGTQNVVAILPPGYTTTGCQGICPSPHVKLTTKPETIALLFQRRELQPSLALPVTATLPLPYPPGVPQLAAWAQTKDAGDVAQITGLSMFTERFVNAQDGTRLIELTQQPPS